MSSDKVLAHFDNNAKIILTVDASPVGLGAILSQIGSNGVEQPVSYASRSLSAAEKKYSQIQKEATAIIFGVRKYHQYLYGRSEPFSLRTDHKPLTIIFGKNRGIPEVSANRLQRYALFLSAYNYEIEFISSAANTADFLSRALPNNSSVASSSGKQVSDEKDLAAYVNFAVDGCLPVTRRDLQTETTNDSVLKYVSKYVQNGWPPKVTDNQLKPFFLCRLQISFENGILLRGHKVIIPKKLRTKILNELHSSHFGIVKMKAEARARFWFPGIDAALEQLVAACDICAQLRPSPPRAPLAPWPHPPHAFHRIHMDFLGPMCNKMFLVIVDAYSKWVECYVMNNNITTKAVITKLSDFMSRFGMPTIIVTDNGTSFASQEFANFCKLNEISHLFSPVYHAMSNGQAESFVKIIKKGINSILISGNKDDFQNRLSKYLFDYRNSVNSTTETSPAQLVFGQNLRSRLDLISKKVVHPSSSSELSVKVDRKQCSQVKNYGGKIKNDFAIGNTVWFKQFINKSKFNWSKGNIIRKLGKVLYKIKLPDSNKNIVRHRNQLQAYKDNDFTSEVSADVWDVTLPQEEEITEASSNNLSDSAQSTVILENANMESPRRTEVTTSEPGTPRIPSDISATSGSLDFGTPRHTTDDDDDNDDDVDDSRTPMPVRIRRNRPLIDYKKFF